MRIEHDLYHYTSLGSFQQIFDSCTLRLHEHKHMNDYNEIRLFFLLIRAAVDSEMKTRDKLFHGYYTRSREEIYQTIKYFERMIMDNEFFNIFILALTEHRDSQVMWNNFAKTYGLNFAIPVEMLTNKVNENIADICPWILPQWILKRVSYVDSLNEDKLQELLDEYIIIRNYKSLAEDDKQNINMHMTGKSGLPGYKLGIDALLGKQHDSDCNCQQCEVINQVATASQGYDATTTLRTLINDVIFALSQGRAKNYAEFRATFAKSYVGKDSNGERNLAIFKIYTLLTYMGTIKDIFYCDEAEWRLIAFYKSTDKNIKYAYYGEQLMTAFIEMQWQNKSEITNKIMLSGLYNYLHIDKLKQQQDNLINYMNIEGITVDISRAILRK